MSVGIIKIARITKKLLKEIEENPESISSYDTKTIKKIFDKLDDEYHNKGISFLSDDVYDNLKDIVLENSKESKELINSLDSKVGAPPAKKQKVELPFWMGSMDKLNPNSIKNFSEKYKGKYVVSDKLDGISSLLTFDSGKNVKMFTRGDGVHGQDITHIIKYIGNFKAPSAYKWEGKQIVLRGELIMKKETFEKLGGSNARNVVAGIINKKKAEESLLKDIDFIVYNVIEPNIKPSECESFVKKHFNNIEYVHNEVHDNLDPEYLKSILSKRRSNNNYNIDGIVISHDAVYPLIANKNPKHSFAFKDNSFLDYKETTVLGIEWNISKDGYVKPTILVDPIELSGVIIKRTSGFNADYIVKNKIIQGTRVQIKRSGDVIPYIVKVLNEKTVKDDENFILSKTLPKDLIWEWNETKKDIISNNYEETNFKKLEYFYTKVKIPSLSEGTLRKLYNRGFKKPIDVYNIDIKELSDIIGEKMATKVTNGRANIFKTTTFKDIMIASNAFGRSIGEKKIESICNTMDCYEIIKNDNKKVLIGDLMEIDGVSTKTGSLFLEGIDSFKRFIIDNPFPILDNGVRNEYKKDVKIEVKKDVDNNIKNKKIENKTFLFTGVRDKNLETYVQENGGKITNTFNKNVNVLVIKDDFTNNKKVEKAIENGIEILTIEQIYNIIKNKI